MGDLAVLDTLSKSEAWPGAEVLSSSEPSGGSTSLRRFIQILDDAGLLVRVRYEADWRFEIGRMTRESRASLLFENVKDYPGQRVFTTAYVTRTQSGWRLVWGSAPAGEFS